MRSLGPVPDSDVLTVTEASALLRIGRNAVYDGVGRGEIPHRRIGKLLRFSRFALLKWLEGKNALSGGERS